MRKPLEQVIGDYQRNIYAAAYSICQNSADANDIVQDTFVQYYRSDREFNDEEHLKAWLLRAAINRAKNLKLSFWHRNSAPLEEAEEIGFNMPEYSEVFDAIMKLPEKYRLVIHLFYYEDLSAKEIAGLLNITESNVRKRLSRGREQLRKFLEEI